MLSKRFGRSMTAALVLTLGVAAQNESRPAVPPAPPAVEADAPSLVAKLESESFAEREAALKALRALGEKARPTLEAHRDAKGIETRTRVRELLDELDAAKPGRLAPPTDGPTPGGRRGVRDLRTPLDELPEIREQLEEMRRMQAEMEKLFRERGGVFGGRDLPLGPGGVMEFDFGPGGSASSTRTILRDGVALSLTESDEGVKFEVAQDGAKESYRAKDLETLKQEHPELVEKYGDSGLFDASAPGVFRFGPGVVRRAPRAGVAESRPSGPRRLEPVGPEEAPNGGRRLRPESGATSPSAPPVAPSPRLGRRLGVSLDVVPPLLDKHLKLGGVGVLVVGADPGTPAAEAGLAADDLLTHCDGREIRTPEDLRRAVAAAGETAVLRFVREGAPREATVRFSNPR